MNDIDIINSQFNTTLPLEITPELRAGFPSPAEEYLHDSLDFNRDLIKHPEATFYGRVTGDSMTDAGINDGDIAVIDKANKEFTIKYLDTTHKDQGYIELRPANPKYKPIRIGPDDEFEVWGVVIFTIKPWN